MILTLGYNLSKTRKTVIAGNSVGKPRYMNLKDIRCSIVGFHRFVCEVQDIYKHPYRWNLCY